jgi:hypothetical protein
MKGLRRGDSEIVFYELHFLAATLTYRSTSVSPWAHISALRGSGVMKSYYLKFRSYIVLQIINSMIKNYKLQLIGYTVSCN